MRVLLVEDSERLRRSVGRALREAGYALDVAADGPDGLWRARSTEYDVIVLDLMLPGMDGLALLRSLRASGGLAHVLILTARDTVEDRVTGLRAGADDYLVKPFALDELLARVEALVRRRHDVRSPRLRFGDLEVDTLGRRALLGGRDVELSPREFALLHFLALRPGEVVTRTRIEAALYDERAELTSNVIDATVYSLRKKVDRPGAPSVVATRRGEGYVFRPPPPPPAGGDGGGGDAGDGPEEGAR